MSAFRGAGVLLALAAFVLGCESGRVSPTGEPLTSSPAARPPAPSSTRSARRPRPAPPTAPQVLKLKGGATMTMPAGATARRKPGGLPAVVQGAHNFKLPGGRQRLLVSELDLEGQSCAKRLDAEWAKMKESRADSDPERLKLRRTSRIEERTVAGHRVLYSEAMQGTSLADAGRPFAAAASAFMCEGHNLLLIMYMSDQGKLAAEVRPMIDAIIASYQPPR